MKTLDELSDETWDLGLRGLELIDGELNIRLSDGSALVICEDEDGDPALFFDRKKQIQ